MRYNPTVVEGGPVPDEAKNLSQNSKDPSPSPNTVELSDAGNEGLSTGWACT